MGKMKELFIKERNEENEMHSYIEQQITINDVVEQIAEAIEKLTTAATEQSKLLRIMTDKILNLESRVKQLENDRN
jgi:hypothetical protein